MRKIEFRAYCPETKYIAYQGNADLETIQSFMFHWGDKILMQYTGLRDMKGKKIYDGDFVKWIECKYVITWINDDACFKAISVDRSITTTLNLHEHCEIMGNIFENPEFLNE